MHAPSRRPRATLPQLPVRSQRGVATLLVVMALFFLVSMVAAYTSRNLVFEQRTSANQYRATQAFEVADGGLEWALAQLNGGRVDAACALSTDGTQQSFRNRYLTVDIDTGTVAPVRWISPAAGAVALSPSCRRNAAGWACNCPTDSEPALPDADAVGISPVFRLQIQGTTTPGIFRIESTACTANDDACLRAARGVGAEAAARVNTTVVLTPALAAPPAAAITARGDFAVGSPLRVVNQDAASNGLTIRAGGAVSTPADLLVSAPGAPGGQSVLDHDPSLAAMGPERFFSTVFGIGRDAYRQQPSVVTMTCGGGCGDRLRDTVAANPGRPVWVTDALVVDSDVEIGSPAQPALLVTVGGLQLAAGAHVVGVVYVQAADWAASAGGTIDGAVLAEGHVNGAGAPEVHYDPATLKRVRATMGTVVRVPGGWRDF